MMECSGRPERRTLYVGLIPDDVTLKELCSLFNVEETEVKLVEAGVVQNRGKHAFVTLPTAEIARDCCARFQGHKGMKLGIVKGGPTARSRDEARVDPQRISEQRLPELRRVHVVLCDPEYATNVGAVARLCGSFGTGQLAIVQYPPKSDSSSAAEASGKETLKRFAEDESAQHASTHGRPWLDGYAQCSSVSEAKARFGCKYTVGLTARMASGKGRNVLRIPVTLESFAESVARQYLFHPEECEKEEELPHIALVFGRESDGLHNSELAECDGAVTIPVGGVFNLSHSVAVTLYQVAMSVQNLHKQAQELAPRKEDGHAGATETTATSIDDMLKMWKAHCEQRQFTPQEIDNSITCLRNILIRAGATETEIKSLSAALRPSSALSTTTTTDKGALTEELK